MAELNDLMTIKEFAAASGRSPQTLYKQLSTRLAAFLREVDGQKYIERRALGEVFGIGTEQPVQPQENNSCNRENNSEHELYAILREELAAKNRQIEQLQAQLAEQTQINKELAQSINADRRNELAGTMQQLLSEGGSGEQMDTSEPETVATVEPSEPVAPVKRRRWAWPWKKK